MFKESSKPIQYREILATVKEKVEFDRVDGVLPAYRVTDTLVRATLGIMVDLGAVTKMKPGWSFTERGQEVVDLLSKHP